MRRAPGCFIGLLLACTGLLVGPGPIARAQEPLTFTVNSADDSNDGFCTTTHCSLREAIERANNRPGADTITFALPGAGPHTIRPTSALPAITEAATIDALPNCAGDQQVVIDGTQAGDADGLRISSPSGTVVRGLVISNFASPGRAGVSFEGGSRDDRSPRNTVECALIGTDPTGSSPQPNYYGVRSAAPRSQISRQSVISGNISDGILFDAGSEGGLADRCLIGTNRAGTAPLPNHDDGVHVNASGSGGAFSSVISANGGDGVESAGSVGVGSSKIGTDVTGSLDLSNASGVGVKVTIGGAGIAGNLISGHEIAGVWVKAEGAASLGGNQIGTNAAGTAALPNGVGVLINGRGSGLSDNLISGNGRGVELRQDPLALHGAEGTQLRRNLIGTDASGAAPLPNATEGILIAGGFFSQIETRNVIAFNGQEGIFVEQGFANTILDNSIFSNGALGIDLAPRGPTPNDPGDSDSGPNDLQNFPVLTKAEVGDGKTTFEGTLQSRPNTSYQIQLYQSPACDPSGFGEGQLEVVAYLAVTTDASGNASFSLTVTSELPAGDQITATASIPIFFSPSDRPVSSEFSRCISARSRPPDCSTVQATPDELPAGHGQLVLVALSGATDPDGDPVELTVSGVTQDEPVRSPGDRTAPDAVASVPGHVRLRAERSSQGDGRVYRISFVGSDGRGGECTGTVKVGVRRKKTAPAIDSAPPSFDSFGR